LIKGLPSRAYDCFLIAASWTAHSHRVFEIWKIDYIDP
jgi:hypothetical protein